MNDTRPPVTSSRASEPAGALVERFLAAYNELDHILREYVGRDDTYDHAKLLRHAGERTRAIRADLGRLQRLAKLRNVLVHTSGRMDRDLVAVPCEAAVQWYESLVDRLRRPPTVEDAWVPARDVFSASHDDLAVEVMAVMAKKGYSQVPVLESGRVAGVFSESTPVAAVAADGELLITRDLRVRDFARHIGLQRDANECFEFVGRRTPVAEVAAMFAAALREGRRVGAVLVTERGAKSETLLGLITPWDVAGFQDAREVEPGRA